jgi:type VI secretion system protein ImpJ
MQLSRVVWQEGMHLAQHHFQAQSRYVETAVHFALSSLFFAPYGLTGITLDGDALHNGTIVLQHAQGIMPDGLPFDIDASDAPPAPFVIGDRFSPTHDSHLVMLTIPAYQPDRANCLPPDGPSAPRARFAPVAISVLDDTRGRDERSVSVGRKNFALALDDAVAADHIAMPIARVRRGGKGHFVYDPEYIPPLLHLGASARLLEIVQRLVNVLDEKSSSMSRGRTGSVADFARQEVAGFWLLHTVNASVAPLRHLLQVKRVHPERLYVEMARLAGGLCTFSLDAHPHDIPLYDHDQLTDCFDTLDRFIRAGVELVSPTHSVVIPLSRTAPSLYTAAVTDPRCLGPSRWILGVRSNLDPVTLATRVPQLVKFCSRAWIQELVRRAFPGMSLTHLPIPPAGITPRSDAQYFLIAQTGGCWETMRKQPEIGVYVPDGIPMPELELTVLLDA